MNDKISESENPYSSPVSGVTDPDTSQDLEQSKEPFSMATVFFACMFFGFLANGAVSFLPANFLPRLHLLDLIGLSWEVQAWVRFFLPGVLGVITYRHWYPKHPESDKPDYAAVIVAMVVGMFFG